MVWCLDVVLLDNSVRSKVTVAFALIIFQQFILYQKIE